MDALEKALSPKKKVLVIGAGLIGLKCVEGIAERVGSVTVVDLADRILPSILDGEGAAIIQRQIEAKGIKFILNDCAAKLALFSSMIFSARVYTPSSCATRSTFRMSTSDF